MSDSQHDYSADSAANVLFELPERCLKLDASETPVDVARGEIKDFVRSVSVSDDCLVCVEGVDEWPDDEQSAFRRTIEQFDDRARFVVSCNQREGLIRPLRMRFETIRRVSGGGS